MLNLVPDVPGIAIKEGVAVRKNNVVGVTVPAEQQGATLKRHLTIAERYSIDTCTKL